MVFLCNLLNIGITRVVIQFVLTSVTVGQGEAKCQIYFPEVLFTTL